MLRLRIRSNAGSTPGTRLVSASSMAVIRTNSRGTLIPDSALKIRTVLASMIMVVLPAMAVAQVPASFEAPVLGYLFDAEHRGVRPITGIPGSSTIGAPIPLAVPTETLVFLPDQRHAIVGSSERPETFVLDLRELTEVPIRGTSSAVTAMRISPRGSAAALYYAAANKVLVVTGLPEAPVIRATIDISFSDDPLRHFAVADDGTTALLSFSLAEHDSVYAWTASTGPHHVSTASTVSDMTFLNEDAVVVDSGKKQALLIRNVRQQAVPALIASAEDGLSQPVAAFISSRNEIYIGDSSGIVLVLDSTGHILRKAHCSCTITTMVSLANSAVRLTDRSDQPMFIMDGSEFDRFLFVPALSVPLTQEGRQ